MHPVCRQPVRKNEITEYAADMNIILTYYKCDDDWRDERKLLKLAYARLLKKKTAVLRRITAKKQKSWFPVWNSFLPGKRQERGY